MTKKERTIIGALGAAVVVVLACLGVLMLTMLSSPSRPASPTAVAEIVDTAIPEATARQTNTPRPPSTPTPKSASADAAPKANPEPLRLLEAGYVVVVAAGPFVEYGFVMQNPNSMFGAQFPMVRITMRDAAGQVIGTTEKVLNRIMPSETLGWGDQADPNGQKPAKVEFEVLDPGRNWKPADQMAPVGFKPFTVAGLKVNKSLFGTSFTGELVNPNDAAFEQVAVSILLRDKAGKIVVGYTDFPKKLPANGKVPFEVRSLGEVPEYSKFEAYTTPW